MKGARWAEGSGDGAGGPPASQVPQGRATKFGVWLPHPHPAHPSVLRRDLLRRGERHEGRVNVHGVRGTAEHVGALRGEPTAAVCRCAAPGYYQGETTGRCGVPRVRAELGAHVLTARTSRTPCVRSPTPTARTLTEPTRGPYLPCTVCEDRRQLRVHALGWPRGVRGRAGAARSQSAHPGGQGLQGVRPQPRGQPPWPRASRRPPDLSHQGPHALLAPLGQVFGKAILILPGCTGFHALVIGGCGLGPGWVADEVAEVASVARAQTVHV